MVQATDRVLAKTMVKVAAVAMALVGLDNEKSSDLLKTATLLVANGNVDLVKAIRDVVAEVGEELVAENTGQASSIVGESPIAIGGDIGPGTKVGDWG